MAQFGRPSTDTTRDNWEEDDGTTTNIFDQVDEVSADDADYIRTQLTPTSDVYVTKLTSMTNPDSSINHVVRYRYGKDAAAGDTINLVVQLRQGYVSESALGTLIASATHTDVAVFPVAGSITLSGSEADAITNYADLYLRVVGSDPSTWPTSLLVATRQHPVGSFYATRRSATRGTVLTDPVTGLWHIPLSTTASSHDYASGPGMLSLPWGSPSKYTAAFMDAAGTSLVVDVTKSTGALGSNRTTPWQQGWLAVTASRNPATPQIWFYLKNVSGNYKTLARYDTNVDADAASGVFPKDLSAVATYASNEWMHISDDEQWFSFQAASGAGANRYVLAYDSVADVATKKTLADMDAAAQAVGGDVVAIDEHKLMRDGSYITIDAENAVGGRRLIRWDLATHVLTDVTSVVTAAHAESIGAFMLQKGANGCETYDPVSNTRTTRYSAIEVMDGPQHWGAQWKQGVADLDKWVLAEAFSSGQLQNMRPTLTLHSGTAGVDPIYKFVPSLFGGSGQTMARITSGGLLKQTFTGNSFKLRDHFTRVASLAAITAPGEEFFDEAGASGPANTWYLRPFDNIDLVANTLHIIATCPPALDDALGFVRVGGASSTGGKAVHLLGHHYSFYLTDYLDQPRANCGPDGEIVLYDSNDGDAAAASISRAWLLLKP